MYALIYTLSSAITRFPFNATYLQRDSSIGERELPHTRVSYEVISATGVKTSQHTPYYFYYAFLYNAISQRKVTATL
jgi:hypothetical protein